MAHLTLTYFSRALGMEVRLEAVLPDIYRTESSGKMPLVLLLHVFSSSSFCFNNYILYIMYRAGYFLLRRMRRTTSPTASAISTAIAITNRVGQPGFFKRLPGAKESSTTLQSP